MRLLVIALVALIAAVAFGTLVAEDPGFIVIGYGGKVLRTTFAFFMLVLLVAAVALYALIRLFVNMAELRRRWRHWAEEQRRRRAHRSLASGLLALAAGDFAKAERLFSRGVDDDAQPEVHYLAAAQAAQAMHASGRRDNYLRLAHDISPEAAAALDIKRAEWLIENGQLDDAQALLEDLTRTSPPSPQLLRLRLAILRARGDDAGLLGLVPDLRRDRVVSFDEANALERDAAVAVLGHPHANRDALKALWGGLSKPMRAEPAVIEAYVKALCAIGGDDEAEALLRRRLESHWDTGLAALYGEIRCEPPAKQLRKADAWAMSRGEDPGLMLTRARLAVRAGLWGQAKSHLDKLVVSAPTPLVYRLQAETAEGRDDPEAAAAYRKMGLEMATGVVVPTPPDALDATEGAA